jgi:hypothetical protein
MLYICKKCQIDSQNHSIKKVKEINNIIYIYTCPSKAKLYNDVESILDHYNGILSEIPKNKKWVWIFDSIDFDLKHCLNINVAIELAKLINNKFSFNLIKIIIINETFYITTTYRIVKVFLSKDLQNLIEFNKKYNTYDEILVYYNCKN